MGWGGVVFLLSPPDFPQISTSFEPFGCFNRREYGANDLTVYHQLSFGSQPGKVFEINVIANQHQVDAVAVAAIGYFAGQVSLSDIPDPVDHLFNQAVETYMFPEDADDIRKKWMIEVGPIHLAVLFHAGDE